MIKKFIKRRYQYFLLTITISLFIYSFIGFAETLSVKEILTDDILRWLSYDQALTKSKIENIPTLIYFYSDNCGWCRKLENETFTSQQVKELMNSDFAIVKINSHSSKTVIGGEEEMTERQLSQDIYRVRANPTIWFLTSNEKRIASLPGFVSAEDFINVLNYIKDGYYRDYTFQEYMDK